jgi:hypothetical protein
LGDDTDVRNRDSGTSYRPGLAIGAGLVIGAGLGISFGSVYGDVAMGLVYGAALGLALGAIIDGFIRRFQLLNGAGSDDSVAR